MYIASTNTGLLHQKKVLHDQIDTSLYIKQGQTVTTYAHLYVIDR